MGAFDIEHVALCSKCRAKLAENGWVGGEALKCLMAARELIESIAIIQGMYAHAARQGRSYKAQALIEINDAIAALTKATPSGTAGEGV